MHRRLNISLPEETIELLDRIATRGNRSHFIAEAVTRYLAESAAMASDRKRVKIWYDAEGDYLELTFDQKPGYFRETQSDQVMEKVDDQGNVLRFSVLRVSAMKAKPLEVAL